MPEPLEILRKYWKYDSFRPLQEDIIRSVLQGNDTLALLPTGGGKSICYQVPALCKNGICIVVSPLIALMKDQVFHLKKKGIQAEAIYAGLHYREIDRLLDNCIHGDTKLLYLSPERLASELARERIRQMDVNLLAVDEAHCISQWGYDFRPPYLQIAEIRDLLPKVPVLAVTATATREVVEDIQEKLLFASPNVLTKSFARPNLAYVVLKEENKPKKLLEIVRKVPGAGVVYARNRKKTKEIARFLIQNKVSATYYHAGLSAEDRNKHQEDWLENRKRIMVSTNAFGMGIDKPDVRTVVHLDLPDNLEAYFQEAGRAGRDGKKSYAILLFGTQDQEKLEKNIDLSYPGLADIRQVYRALGSYFQLAVGGGEGQSYDFDILDFCNNFKLDLLKTFSCLKILEQEGWIILTEAVFIPSTFYVRVSREQLYDFQLRFPGMDKVIKTLLRVTEGAFQHHVMIQEPAIARFLQIPTDKLIPLLKQLHQEGIIEYRPSKDKPQLIFSMERVEAGNLTIDLAQFNFRKQRAIYRMEKAIAYATRAVCRSQQLLSYFGETSPPCGICDVCLGRTEPDLTPEVFERYKTKISQLLKKEKLTERELLESFSTSRHENVLKTLTFLMDEGFIERVEGKLSWIEK